MIYRRFGKTELNMPVLSAGFLRSMHFRHGGEELSQIPSTSQDNLSQLVAAALEQGITHLETARNYGSSEYQLGQVLTDYPRDSYLLQTKVVPTADPNQFRAHVIDSMARLQVQRLDLLTIHGINDFSSLYYTCRANGCLNMARRLQKQGLVDHVGFSSHGSCELLLAAVNHDADQGFDYLNLHWYTIRQVLTPVIQRAQARDMGVLIISPTDKGGRLQAPPEKLVQLSQPLSPMQFNDLYCLAQPGIHTITVGAAAAHEFDAHLAAIQLTDLGQKQVKIINQRWQAAMLTATGVKQPDAHWTKLPNWDQTAGYINVPFILWLDHLDRGWDLHHFCCERYEKLGLEMAWVPGNNANQAHQYDLSPLANALQMSHQALQTCLAKTHQRFSYPIVRD